MCVPPYLPDKKATDRYRLQMDLYIGLALIAQIADARAKHVHPQVVDLTESRQHNNMHTYSSFDWHNHWITVTCLVLSSLVLGVCLAACCKFYCHKYTHFRFFVPSIRCCAAHFVEGVPRHEYYPLLKDAAPPPYSKYEIP